MNNVSILGNLTQDPIRKEVNGGVVCTFRIASGKSNTRGGRVFIDIDAWGKLGGRCAQHLSKGRQVYVKGSLVQREWVNRKGEKQTSTFIQADDVEFVGSPTTGRDTAGVVNGVEGASAS